MKNVKKCITLIFISLLLTGCQKEKFNINKEVILRGKVTTREIIENNESYKVNILNLDEPIIVNGTKVKKIELDYDKDLKNDKELEIKGIIKNNDNSNIDISYSFSVSDIDDLLSFVNTYNSKDFSMTIPTEIIKICSIKRINNGFIIYNSSDKGNLDEIFRIISMPNEEFSSIQQNYNIFIEKVVSNKEKTIVIEYKNDINQSDEYDENINQIIKQIDTIKNTVKIK